MIHEKNIRTLNDLIDAAARHRGRHAALVTLETSLSYHDLRQSIVRAAAGLHAAGVRRGERVAILHRNGAPFVIAYFALARLGAVAVPINFMIKNRDEVAFLLNDCLAVAAVTQMELLPVLAEAAGSVASLRQIWISDLAPGGEVAPHRHGPHGHGHAAPRQRPFDELLRADAHRLPHAAVSENDPAGILYTSGTTGVSKGVVLTHRNLVVNCTAAAAHMHLRQKDVVLCILPMFHTFAWTANVLVPIRMGITFAVASSVTPAKPWLKLMARCGVTLFTAVPPVFAILAKEALGLKGLLLRWWFFRQVRLAISGAGPLPREVQRRFETALRVPIFEGYGLTETSPIATINPPGRRKPGTVGVPIRGMKVGICDEQGRALPPGKDGEVCLRGECVMAGYHNRPDETRQAFTGDGWFKTGDVGCLDRDGYLSIKDRKKDMIIVKGLKVFSAQVESAILEHPAVAEAAVIGVADETGDERIKAFVVLRPGACADRAELLRHCRRRLDAYKRPRDVEIVDSLPKNTLDKVLKDVLRRQELARRGGRPA